MGIFHLASFTACLWFHKCKLCKRCKNDHVTSLALNKDFSNHKCLGDQTKLINKGVFRVFSLAPPPFFSGLLVIRKVSKFWFSGLMTTCINGSWTIPGIVNIDETLHALSLERTCATLCIYYLTSAGVSVLVWGFFSSQKQQIKNFSHRYGGLAKWLAGSLIIPRNKEISSWN
jgi:hypothetical protein